MNDNAKMKETLTGDYCFATDMWGNLILHVEVEHTGSDEPWTRGLGDVYKRQPKINIVKS